MIPVQYILLFLSILPIMFFGAFFLFTLRVRTICVKQILWYIAVGYVVWYGVNDFAYHQGRLLNETDYGQYVERQE